MSIEDNKTKRAEALIQIANMIKHDEKAFHEFLKTEEGMALYKLACTEVAATIEITVSKGSISFDFDLGDYILTDYNFDDQERISAIIGNHMIDMLTDMVEVLNEPHQQS